MTDIPVPDHDPDGLWVGIDLGTQSVLVVVTGAGGGPAATGTAPLTSHRAGPRHEQDPEQWWTAVTTASRQALAGLDATRVRGVAVDATSGTVLLADAAGTPLTPGLMYDDSRALGPHTDRVNEAGAAVWSAVGYGRMQPSWALPKIGWLLAQDRRFADPATRLLHQGDLVGWRLAGRQVATDASQALKTGYQLAAEEWPEAVLTSLGVPSTLLPRVVAPGTPLGTVCPAAAEATGIPAGTVLVAGMTDGCAAQLGSGTVEPGAWNSVLGTTLVLKGVSRSLVRDPSGVVYCHRGPEGTWLPGGASSSGAGALTRLFPGADLERLTERAARRQPRAGAPVAYPLVGAAGERFPFAAPDAEPFVLGVLDDEVDLFAANLLGLACLERLCLEYLASLGAPVDGPLSFTGGGARNRYWSQLRSDVLGREVRLPERAEPGHGMALLAMATTTGLPLPVAAKAMAGAGARLRPEAARTGHYQAVYAAFVDELVDRGWLDRIPRRPAP